MIRAVAVIVGVLMAFGYIYFLLNGPQGWSALAAKREEIRRLHSENAILKQEIEVKAERVRQLRESQAAQELEIRKRMKLVKPGETVFVLSDQLGSGPASGGASPPPAQAEDSPSKPVVQPPKPAVSMPKKAKPPVWEEESRKAATAQAEPQPPQTLPAPLPAEPNPVEDPPPGF
ncbi:MAG: septum formation initiator family protein [Bryobacteraceae bacterium]|nr:septum formation initiator family protein [Bryobacteraceae bacterium]MDW8379213.1 septum formation initiator family protein [Bryobacterales bacterium]